MRGSLSSHGSCSTVLAQFHGNSSDDQKTGVIVYAHGFSGQSRTYLQPCYTHNCTVREYYAVLHLSAVRYVQCFASNTEKEHSFISSEDNIGNAERRTNILVEYYGNVFIKGLCILWCVSRGYETEIPDVRKVCLCVCI
jgi:hypothetical protein